MPASAWIATFHPEFTPVLFDQTSSLQQSTDPDQNAFSPLPSSFERTSISGKSKAKFALSVKTTSKNDDIYSFEFPHVALPFDLTLGEVILQFYEEKYEIISAARQKTGQDNVLEHILLDS